MKIPSTLLLGVLTMAGMASAAEKPPGPRLISSVSVWRGDSPEAAPYLKRMLGDAGYYSLKPILHVSSLVISKEPLRVIAGEIRADAKDGSPEILSFWWPLHFPPGPLLVLPYGVVNGPVIAANVLADNAEFIGVVPRDPLTPVDFLMFEDMSTWGADRNHFRQQLRDWKTNAEKIADAIHGQPLDKVREIIESMAGDDANSLTHIFAIGFINPPEWAEESFRRTDPDASPKVSITNFFPPPTTRTP